MNINIIKMKLGLTFIALVSSIALYGQTDSLKHGEKYFEFSAEKRGLLEKGYGYKISINFGQKYLSADSLIRIMTIDKIQSFSKKEDVLEFMNALGWTLVTAYATSHDHFYKYYYILKKTI